MESNYAKKALPEWQKEHPSARVMRNNTGMAWQGKIGNYTEIQGYRGIHHRILENPRPIFFGVGLPVKDKKTGRTKQKGGGDYIGWESKYIASPCCGSCDVNKDCELLKYELDKCENNKMILNTILLNKCENYIPHNYKKIAVFLNLETKSKNGKETPEQIKFRKAVQEAGGIAIVLKESEG